MPECKEVNQMNVDLGAFIQRIFFTSLVFDYVKNDLFCVPFIN